MKEEYLYPHEMFDISAQGAYCGVFMPTEVMKKLERINAKWAAEIKQLLNEHKNELLVSSWTGFAAKDADGKLLDFQTVHYSDPDCEWESVEQRIDLFKPSQPNHVDVYICDRETAESIAKEIYEEKHPGPEAAP